MSDICPGCKFVFIMCVGLLFLIIWMEIQFRMQLLALTGIRIQNFRNSITYYNSECDILWCLEFLSCLAFVRYQYPVSILESQDVHSRKTSARTSSTYNPLRAALVYVLQYEILSPPTNKVNTAVHYSMKL